MGSCLSSDASSAVKKGPKETQSIVKMDPDDIADQKQSETNQINADGHSP